VGAARHGLSDILHERASGTGGSLARLLSEAPWTVGSLMRGGFPGRRAATELSDGGDGMRVVSLNLDISDASVIQRELAGLVAACSCWHEKREEPCERCVVLGAAVVELDRTLTRPPAARLGRSVTDHLFPDVDRTAAGALLSSDPGFEGRHEWPGAEAAT